MRVLQLSVLCVVVSVGCGGAPESPPAASPTSAPVASSDRAAQDAATIQAQTAALNAREQDNRRQEEAASKEGEAAMQRAQAARQAEEKAREKEESDRCAKSRPSRITNLKLTAAGRIEAEARIVKASKAIRASCKIGSKRTGATRITHDAGGWRLAPELMDDVTCTSLPAGITKQDAYVILSRVRDGVDIVATGPLFEREDITVEDVKCSPHDRAAGMDVDAPRYENDWSTILKGWK